MSSAATAQTSISASSSRPSPASNASIPLNPTPPPVLERSTRLRSGVACSTSWSAEEQAALETAMVRFPPDKVQPLERYLRIAASLAQKGARDVALRIKWMAVCQAARKRQLSENDGSKQKQQQQYRRERGQSIFNIQPKPSGPLNSMYGPTGVQLNTSLDDHGIASVGVVSGPIAQLLEQNYAVLNQFKQNMAQYKVNENTDLLVRFRDNILAILSHMNSMQGVMQQMPPLPVRMNIELATNFLPKGVGAPFPMGMPFVPPMPMPGFMPGMGMNFMPPMAGAQNGQTPGQAGTAATHQPHHPQQQQQPPPQQHPSSVVQQQQQQSHLQAPAMGGPSKSAPLQNGSVPSAFPPSGPLPLPAHFPQLPSCMPFSQMQHMRPHLPSGLPPGMPAVFPLPPFLQPGMGSTSDSLPHLPMQPPLQTPMFMPGGEAGTSMLSGHHPNMASLGLPTPQQLVQSHTHMQMLHGQQSSAPAAASLQAPVIKTEHL